MVRWLTALTPGEPLPPGGREPPEAHKLALLRELSTFITWRELLIGLILLAIHRADVAADGVCRCVTQPAREPGAAFWLVRCAAWHAACGGSAEC